MTIFSIFNTIPIEKEENAIYDKLHSINVQCLLRDISFINMPTSIPTKFSAVTQLAERHFLCVTGNINIALT
jgi:hypothetical protein